MASSGVANRGLSSTGIRLNVLNGSGFASPQHNFTVSRVGLQPKELGKRSSRPYS